MRGKEHGVLVVCDAAAFLGQALELAMERVLEEAGGHPGLVRLKQLDLGQPAVAGEGEHLASCQPCAARQGELHWVMHRRPPAVGLQHFGSGNATRDG